MKRFDLLVIGSGSGLDVAAEAAGYGMSVAVVEEGPFGGTCLNRGCISSKMLIHCADVMETIQRASLFGIKAHVESVDWQFIIRRVFDEIDAEAQSIEDGNKEHPNIMVYKGHGRFVGKKVLEVNGERITARTVVIAAGTRPNIPEIPGITDVPFYTSDDVMRLPQQPKRLVILGGGYIAAELAHFFGTLGTKVTIIHRGPLLLRREDGEIARRFTEVYKRKFTLLLNSQVTRVYRKEKAVVLDVSTGGRTTKVTADVLLTATGRIPNTDLLEVTKTRVETDQRRFIRTDKYLETNVPGIWALGDIVGRYLLKHSANLEASYVANNVLHPDQREPVDYHAMPHAIFASPQVGSVGLTEEAAKEQKFPYIAATYNYRDTAYGSSIEDRDGFVKVLAQRKTREIVGCHIIGTEASALIQEVANAMRSRQTIDAITQSIYIHPALPEVVQRAFVSVPL